MTDHQKERETHPPRETEDAVNAALDLLRYSMWRTGQAHELIRALEATIKHRDAEIARLLEEHSRLKKQLESSQVANEESR
jgi:hypothetical protein